MVIPPIAAIWTNLVAPDPRDHWTEHLGIAVLKGAHLVLLVLTTLLSWKKLGVLLAITFVIVAAGIVMQVIDDYLVADSIWRKSGAPGYGIGYADGHEMSELGDKFVLIGGFTFAVLSGFRHRVSAPLLS